MRIVSKFHDYYDRAMLFGTDSSLVYIRNPVAINIDKLECCTGLGNFTHFETTIETFKVYSSNINATAVFIGFCGKIYPAIRFLNHEYTMERVDNNRFENYVYSYDKALAFLKKTLSKRAFGVFTSQKHNDIEMFFEKYENVDVDACKEIFLHYRHPVFVLERRAYYDNSEVTFNAQLHNVMFEKVMNSYQAYQEISMFLGSLATPSKPMPIIPDVLKAQTHGFDKYSFRKEKQNKS